MLAIIQADTLIGKRDRVLIGLITYTLVRIGGEVDRVRQLDLGEKPLKRSNC